jgi:hypothetical protein
MPFAPSEFASAGGVAQSITHLLLEEFLSSPQHFLLFLYFGQNDIIID